MLALYNQHTVEGYAEALPLMDWFLSRSQLLSERERVELKLCRVYILLYQENTEQALLQLLELKKENNTVFEEEVSWYFALAYLQLGDLDLTQAELSFLLSSDGQNTRNKAQQLLQRLEMAQAC